MKLISLARMTGLAAVLLLTSCGSDASPESALSSEAASSETVFAPDSPASAAQELTLFDADIKGYDGEVLSFEFAGETYSVRFDHRTFAGDDTADAAIPRKCLSEEIINNPLGEAVKARLRARADFSYIEYCDVVSVNGRVLTNPIDPARTGPAPQEQLDYTLRRTGGTKCTLQNCDYTFEIDVQALPMYMKEIYRDELSPVFFRGYQFTDGRFMIYELLTYPVTDEYGQLVYSIGTDDYVTENCLGFVGTVQSVEGETARILLGDGVTACSVPVYFSDGEVSPGQDAVIFINDTAELWGSGGDKTYDFALVYTDLASLGLDPEALAAAEYIIPKDLCCGRFETASAGL